MDRPRVITCSYCGGPQRELDADRCEFCQIALPPSTPRAITFEVTLQTIGSNRSAVRKVIADWTGRTRTEAGLLLDTLECVPVTQVPVAQVPVAPEQAAPEHGDRQHGAPERERKKHLIVSGDIDEPSARLLVDALTRAGATARLQRAGPSLGGTPSSDGDPSSTGSPSSVAGTVDPRTAQRARFDVVLHHPGSQRIRVMQTLRSSLGLSLADAKPLLEQSSSQVGHVIVATSLTYEAATAAVHQLTDAGAEASIVQSA